MQDFVIFCREVGWKLSLPTASMLWEVIPPAVRVCVAHPSSQATSRLPHPGEGDFLPKTWCSWGTCSIKQWLARGWLKHLPEIQTAASCAEMFPAGTAPASGFFPLHGHVQFKSCSGYSLWIEKQVMQILLAQESCYLTEVYGVWGWRAPSQLRGVNSHLGVSHNTSHCL